MRLHLAHLAEFLGTRELLDLTLYNEAGNTTAKPLMDEAKKRGKENAIEHSALHQGHLELTRQLLGYSPAGAQ
jgi:hypothetical protein